jgi:hypothetical protein
MHSQFLSNRINSLIQKNKNDIGQMNIDSNNREIKFLNGLKKILLLKKDFNDFGFQILIDNTQHQMAN